MKPLNTINKVATLGAGSSSTSNGMEIGLTFAVFVVAGLGLDNWLGTKPAFTIGLFIFAAIGTGLRYYYRYMYEMDIEIERRRERLASGSSNTLDAATQAPSPDPEPRIEA